MSAPSTTPAPTAMVSAPDTYPGFDAFRLLAAWGVAFSHIYPITGGDSALDPLQAVLGKGNSIGNYSLYSLFILSGFLLSQSLSHSTDPIRYLVNRFIRIVPGFAFAAIVSMLFIVPLLTGRPFGEVLFAKDVWGAIIWSINGLRDVTGGTLSFSKHPEMGHFLNGSLWSIPYEVIYYVLLLAVALVVRKSSRIAIVFFALGAVSLLGPIFGFASTDWKGAADVPILLPYALLDKTAPYFCAGAFFYGFNQRWPVGGAGFVTSCLLLAASATAGVAHLAFPLLGPPIIVFLGRFTPPLSGALTKLGDISFGVYLFGWPIGLLMAAKIESTNPLAIFAATAPVVFALAVITQRIVEGPAQKRLKPWILDRLPRFPKAPKVTAEEHCVPWSSLIRNLLAHESTHAWKELCTAVQTAALHALNTLIPTTPSLANLRTAAAYTACTILLIRLAAYPYPLTANWFGFEPYHLITIILVTALILGRQPSSDSVRHPKQP
jgi:peptidoglycan/LPS O-acetylase OafA/YrhL